MFVIKMAEQDRDLSACMRRESGKTLYRRSLRDTHCVVVGRFGNLISEAAALVGVIQHSHVYIVERIHHPRERQLFGLH